MHAIERRLARSVRELAESPAALRRREGDSYERPASGAFVPTDAQWAGGDERARAPALDPHRPARHGQDADDARARRPAARPEAQRAAVRADRQGGAAARRAHGRRGEHDPPAARVRPGRGLLARAGGPDPGPRHADRRRGLDARRSASPTRSSARSARARTCCSSATSTSSRRSGRAACSRTSSSPARVPTVRLTEIFRQAARSLIVRAAHAINAGEPPPTVAGEDGIRDFFFLERIAAADAFEDVCDIAVRRLPATYGLDPAREILVLSPMHKGPLGIEAFNAELRRRLNADGAPVPGLPFRVGDRFVQRRNDHEHQLMNGETGVVVVGRRRAGARDAAVRRRPRPAHPLRRLPHARARLLPVDPPRPGLPEPRGRDGAVGLARGDADPQPDLHRADPRAGARRHRRRPPRAPDGPAAHGRRAPAHPPGAAGRREAPA